MKAQSPKGNGKWKEEPQRKRTMKAQTKKEKEKRPKRMDFGGVSQKNLRSPLTAEIGGKANSFVESRTALKVLLTQNLVLWY